MSLSIVHVTPSVGQTSFGVGQVALNLCLEQGRLGNHSDIWCVDGDSDRRWASESTGVSLSKLYGFPTVGPRSLRYSPKLERFAYSEGGTFQVVHQHGIWTWVSRVTNCMREVHGIPSVIAPHGSLSCWAIRRSNWKKRLALAFYEERNLRLAACLHATSEAEIADFRDFGLTNPIAFIPNGVPEQAVHSGGGDGERFRQQFGLPADRRIVLFLSRITPKKGLPMLVEAINSMRQEFNGWLMVIAGTDEFGHKAEVEAMIERLGLRQQIVVIGPLFDQIKKDAFEAADLFILPSLSEGAPIVILDCLAAGVPLITTKASSWQDLNTYSCGWWVDIDKEAVRDALLKAISFSPSDLARMGERGKRLVAQKYSWKNLAKNTDLLYRWMLGKEACPEWVVTR